VQGQPHWGKRNQDQVLDVLAQAMTAALGERVPHRRGNDDDDANGVDGFVKLPAEEKWTGVQVVAVPSDSDYGAAVATGEPVVVLTNSEAAAWIAGAIEKKRHHALATLILALDIRHASLLSDPVIVSDLLAVIPAPKAIGFKAVWLVGSTAARCTQLA
jgi:hypothetical protein